MFSPSPCGRGVGRGRARSCTWTPMTSSPPMRCRDSLRPSTPHQTPSPPSAPMHSSIQAPSVVRPPATSYATCWWAICSPTAATSLCAVTHYVRSAASSRASPMVRIGNSGSASLCAVHSSRRRVVCRCYSSARRPEGRITAWLPIRPPSHPVWTRSSATRFYSPALVRGASPHSDDVPRPRTTGSSAAS